MFIKSGAFEFGMRALYHIIIYALPIIISILIIDKISKNKGQSIHPAIIIAAFFSYNALYLQIPIYLSQISGLTFLSVLLSANWKKDNKSHAHIITILILFSFSAVTIEAYKPLTSDALVSDKKSDFEGMSLYIPNKSYDKYKKILDFIDNNTEHEDYIFVLPNHSELYFLSGRKNPTPIINSGYSLQSIEDCENIFNILSKATPALIIINIEESNYQFYEEYLTEKIHDILGYRAVASFDSFYIYKKQSDK